MIALMDYAIGSATLYLNRPYTDFSLLLIHVSNDSRGNSSFTIMPTELLKIGKTYNFGNNLDYWYAKIESLQNIGYADENCFIEMIYGININ